MIELDIHENCTIEYYSKISNNFRKEGVKKNNYTFAIMYLYIVAGEIRRSVFLNI